MSLWESERRIQEVVFDERRTERGFGFWSRLLWWRLPAAWVVRVTRQSWNATYNSHCVEIVLLSHVSNQTSIKIFGSLRHRNPYIALKIESMINGI